MLGGGMLRLRVLSTLLALAGVAGDHGARGVPWGAAHARPLGFVGAARLGTGREESAGSESKTPHRRTRGLFL